MIIGLESLTFSEVGLFYPVIIISAIARESSKYLARKWIIREEVVNKRRFRIGDNTFAH